MTAYERDLLCRREAYIMAKRSPWHLWSVQALRAGYVPPLIPGTVSAIPINAPRTTFSARAGHDTRVAGRGGDFVTICSSSRSRKRLKVAAIPTVISVKTAFIDRC